MSDGPFTLIDAFLLLLILTSAGLAMMRGFIREGMLVFTWLLAAVLTYTVYLVAASGLRSLLGSSWLVHGLFLTAVFVGLVTVFTIANREFVQRVRGEEVKGWDQILGFFFGILRGVVLVGVLFRAYTLVFTYEQVPGWFTEARLYPVVTMASNSLNAIAPRPIREAHNRATRSSVPRPVRRGAVPEEDGGEDGAGYSKDERGAIDQLVRNKLDPP